MLFLQFPISEQDETEKTVEYRGKLVPQYLLKIFPPVHKNESNRIRTYQVFFKRDPCLSRITIPYRNGPMKGSIRLHVLNIYVCNSGHCFVSIKN